MFWGERGGGLTGQPVSPLVDTATMATVMNANRVDWGRFEHERRPYSATIYPSIFLQRKETCADVVETR